MALAYQYFSFIEAARQLRLELAADYLVMAAWLAYLKSRLLLPDVAPGDGPSAEDMALALANRLRRLEAIREFAMRMMERPQLNRDVFPRGLPEPIDEIKQPEWTATLYDLLSAYATQRARSALSRVRFKQRTVWSLAGARRARTLDRTIDGLVAHRSVPHQLRRGACTRRNGLCLLVRVRTRNGSRRARRNSSERVIRADLHAQTRRREWECNDA
jgi:chromatin segregation and condensation protein Rec8/ScpA/Scc1 (kleisin family)